MVSQTGRMRLGFRVKVTVKVNVNLGDFKFSIILLHFIVLAVCIEI